MKTILVDDELLSMEEFEMECRDIKDIEIVGKFSRPTEALEYAQNNPIDFALLDVEMPEMNGIELGKKLREIHCEIILIYITGYSKYFVDAMKMKADYCIMKPYDKQDIEDAIRRAKLLSRRQEKRIQVRMLGRFNVFVEGEPVHFGNAKSKELLALCMDHMGGEVSMEEAIDKLWPDREYDEKVKKMYRKAVIFLQKTLAGHNASDIFETNRGSCHVLVKKIDCDYFKYMEDKEKNEELFKGEYLFDYSWGEERIAELMDF